MKRRRQTREITFPYVDTQTFQSDYRMLFNRNYTSGLDIYRLKALRRIVERAVFTQAWLKHVRINVVGTVGPQPTFSKVGDTDRNRLLEYWKEWTDDPTVEGGYSWADLIALMLRSYLVDGRTFGVIKYHEDYTHGIAIDHITREYLYGWGILSPFRRSFEEVDGMQEYRGVIYKESGRIWGMRFHAIDRKATDDNPLFSYFSSKSKPISVPIEDILDVKNSVMTPNNDSIPEDMLAIAARIQQISNLDESVVTSMRVAANKMAFITKDETATSTTPPIEDDQGDDEYIPPLEAEGNTFEELPVGYSVESWDPTTPNQRVENYRKELHKNASACLGVDYATVIGDLEKVNYSSIRHGAISARSYYQLLQSTITKFICVKTLSRVLDWGIFTGKLSLRSQKSLDLAKQTTWRHRAWPWIDPLKDAQASAHMLRMGLQSPQALATGMGVDIDAITDEIQEFVSMMESKNISPETLMAISGLGTSSSMIIEEDDPDEKSDETETETETEEGEEETDDDD